MSSYLGIFDCLPESWYFFQDPKADNRDKQLHLFVRLFLKLLVLNDACYDLLFFSYIDGKGEVSLGQASSSNCI